MSLVLIVIGFLFLLNPCVWIWDVLPDFIGIVLIMIGARRVAFFTEATSKAYNCLTSAMAVSVTKSIISILCAGVGGNIKILIAVVFAALEIMVLIPAITSTIKALDLLQERYCEPGAAIADTKFDKLSKWLVIYTVFRILVGFLPDFAELLPNGRYGYVLTPNGYYPTDGKWMLYVLTSAFTLIFTVIVSVFLIRAFIRYGKDKATDENVVRLAGEFKKNAPESWNARKWKLIKVPFVLCAVASLFLFIDGADCIPKWIAAALLFGVTFAFATNIFERILAFIVNAALCVASFLCGERLVVFFDNYEDEFSTVWSSAAKDEYMTITMLLIIEAVLLFASVMLMTEVVKKTRLRQMREDGTGSRSERILKKEILKMRIAFILMIASVIAYPFLRPGYPVLAITLLVIFDVAFFLYTTRVELEL